MTVQVPPVAGAVSVVPLTVQVPVTTLKLTAPEPLPPVFPSVVVAEGAKVMLAAVAVRLACATGAGLEALPPPHADKSAAKAKLAEAR